MLKKRKISEELKQSVDEEIESIEQEDKENVRREPDFLPERDDVRKRYKKEDIPRSERREYRDTLYDPDLKPEK